MHSDHNHASNDLQPITIHLGSASSPRYKSIGQIEWRDIPPFAVLTGLNGAGKSQLLELLARKLTQATHPDSPQLVEIDLRVDGDNFDPADVAYVPSDWRATGAVQLSLADLQNAKLNMFGQVRPGNPTDVHMNAKRARLAQAVGLTESNQISEATWLEKMPEDFKFLLGDVDVIAGLAHVFLSYRTRNAQELEKGLTRAEAEESLGPPPWKVLNDVLKAAEFPFEVDSPTSTPLLVTYRLKLRDTRDKHLIDPEGLSSGEKMFLNLVAWLYSAQERKSFPRLLIMDEPDAHLHPAMTYQFLHVLKDVLVKQYGVRAILTTHSPSTIALSPEESIFELRRNEPLIQRVESRQAAVSMLTAGLVTVSVGTKYVLVEDQRDVEFYSTVRNVLSDYGPRRDSEALEPSPTIVFLPASRGKGRERTGGGCSVVTEWIAKLSQPPFDEIFLGLIDRDNDHVATDRVHVLGRHSVENYLLDPFAVYAVTLESRQPLNIPGVDIMLGNEGQIRSLPESALQNIVDSVTTAVRAHLNPALLKLNAVMPVQFTNGRVLSYPRWMIDGRGHDLLPAFQAAFGGAKVISPPRLLAGFQRARMIPRELSEVMHSIQRVASKATNAHQIEKSIAAS